MNTDFEIRYAAGPAEVKTMDTATLRKNFLIDPLFIPNRIRLVYTHYDRYIAGGIFPVEQALTLETIEPLKANYFLERREMGIINIGGEGNVEVEGERFSLAHKEALYIGKGKEKLVFTSKDPEHPAKFYINSAPAHQAYPVKKITQQTAEVVTLGAPETSNHRTIYKMIVRPLAEICQLQMGITMLKTGSVWNTMPAHTHDRRMEVYLYFDIPENQAVCHLMGPATETRHIWIQNEQAVISPPWSLHAGAGTSHYTFIWGMAGENLDYGDMDQCAIKNLK